MTPDIFYPRPVTDILYFVADRRDRLVHQPTLIHALAWRMIESGTAELQQQATALTQIETALRQTHTKPHVPLEIGESMRLQKEGLMTQTRAEYSAVLLGNIFVTCIESADTGVLDMDAFRGRQIQATRRTNLTHLVPYADSRGSIHLTQNQIVLLKEVMVADRTLAGIIHPVILPERIRNFLTANLFGSTSLLTHMEDFARKQYKPFAEQVLQAGEEYERRIHPQHILDLVSELIDPNALNQPSSQQT